MIIKNKTRNTILSSDAKVLNSILDKSIGLLNKSNPKSLIFKTHFGIHSLFLKDPIDVLILNNQNEIVVLKENLNPNRFFFWNPKYQIVIELPKNSIKKSKIQLGDCLKFIDAK